MKLTKIYTKWSTLNGSLSEPMMFISDHDVMSDGVFCLQEHIVDLDVTEPSKAETVKSVVDELRIEQKKHRAEIAKLDDRIQSLLCLEHKDSA